MPPETVIGVRVPALRKLAKQLAGTAQAEVFLQALPHGYYEENNLHAFLIELIRDYDRALAETEAFLPYINNWATCDCFCPKVFAKHKKELLVPIRRWLDSGEDFFDLERFAGEGNIGHMVQQVKDYGRGKRGK